MITKNVAYIARSEVRSKREAVTRKGKRLQKQRKIDLIYLYGTHQSEWFHILLLQASIYLLV